MEPETEVARLLDLVDSAWGIIANAGAGDWNRELPEWQRAASKWREDFHAALKRNREPR